MQNAKGTEKDDPCLRSVKNQIVKISPEIKKLYLQFTVKNPPKKDGDVVVDWTIDTDGKPMKPQIVTTDLNDKDLEDGLIKAVMYVTFSEPPFKRYVAHTFKLKDAAGEAKKGKK